jgi:hypothetical protein
MSAKSGGSKKVQQRGSKKVHCDVRREIARTRPERHRSNGFKKQNRTSASAALCGFRVTHQIDHVIASSCKRALEHFLGGRMIASLAQQVLSVIAQNICIGCARV